jgi:hypothetical protein
VVDPYQRRMANGLGVVLINRHVNLAANSRI